MAPCAQRRAKQQRDRVRPAAQDKATEKSRHWLEAGQEALSSDGFVLFYQPIINLHGAEGEFYESSCMGQTGRNHANFFLPVAEQHGLITADRPLGHRPRHQGPGRPRKVGHKQRSS